MTPQEFCKKYAVKVKGKFFDEVTAHSDPNDWPHTTYKVTLSYKRGDAKLKFPYHMGISHTDFDPYGALSSVGSDAAAGEYYFELFCDEFGYDTDSIKHRKTWKACQKMQRKAYAWCNSQQMYEDLTTLEY